MQNHYTTKGEHLTIDSRRLIERWKKEGKSNREIASLLGKVPQTIHTEIKRGTVRQCLVKGRFKEVYSADYAQQSYENNRKRSVKKSSLTKELKEKILHYHNQKFSPEMMVMAKGVNVGISTIYYWIHHGKLGLSKQDLLYPRKGKALKKQASTNFKPAGQSIEQRSEAINLRLENGHYEIDTVLLTRAKNYCLLVLTDRMQDNYTTKAKHLTIDSRRLIERWKKEGKSNREIASLLGKAPQTIHTEIKRGTVRQCLGKGRFKEVYSADYAQQSYENNRKRSVKKSSLTKELKEKILHYHNQKFSLDKKQASTNFKPAGQSIEQRPEAINLRLENGHYEIDTVLLTRAKNYCLLVLTDRLLVLTNRKSRHQIIRLIPNKSAEVVNQALKLILKQHKILSITADNGTEFNRLSDVFSEEHIYYAHPYASWERELMRITTGSFVDGYLREPRK
ncbi:IS1239 transposase [Streptococcus pneumoniae]|nr:IS1239 transposase [Streptococcus pneumoniae]